jgi:hypothetical protein
MENNNTSPSIIDEEYTINHLIKDLQQLNEIYRSKPIVIQAPNGLLFRPVVKQLLHDQYNIFGGWENMKAAIITF